MIKHQVLAALAAASLAATALGAPPDRGEPGSLLLFPEYDSSPGVVTLLSVTNTDDSPASGNVLVRWDYIDGASCLEFNRTTTLTPNDNVTVVSSTHNPGGGAGYVYVYALDPTTHEPILHNHLIGRATVIDGLLMGSHTVEPQSYLGIDPGADTDGRRSLDGIEYQEAADQVLLPRFYGQGAGFDSYLVLVDLTGGKEAETTLNFLVYNDNEQVFSAQHSFNCWTRVPLASVSGLFGNDFLSLATDHDPSEVLGLAAQEAGWMRIDGHISATDFQVAQDPAFVAMLVTRSSAGTSSSPFGQVGVQDNGSLTPALPNYPDCNLNGISDIVEIANGTVLDCDLNGVPDECEGFDDCNGNGIPDACDPDADNDGIPDDCDLECSNDVVIELAPVNNQYHDIDLDALVDALPHSALPAGIAITSITQDEPLDTGGGGPGAGDCDGYGVGGSIATIRAQRDNQGNGRVYVVSYTATGPHGQTCDGTVKVVVKRKKKDSAAVDDGQLYDSTHNCP